jgi:hypothetical protein
MMLNTRVADIRSCYYSNSFLYNFSYLLNSKVIKFDIQIKELGLFFFFLAQKI